MGDEGAKKILPGLTPGFTVIEAVVAMAVFTVVFGGITAAFLSVMRINEKARAIRTVEQNVRFVSEFMAREIRNGEVDFSPTGYNGTIPTQGKVTTLYLKSISGETLRIFFADGKLQLAKGAGTTTLTGNDVTISNFLFYIRPTSEGNQDIITFSYVISSNTSSQTNRGASMNVQSTIAARDYN
ncbi:MAG: hypothetical protein HY397_00570 [Candidatus Doudnabacteria bacterium]|nr:hypothetical protein [Candidatus Doudnabacteria bacterium]